MKKPADAVTSTGQVLTQKNITKNFSINKENKVKL